MHDLPSREYPERLPAAATPAAPLLKLYRVESAFGARYVEAPAMAEAVTLFRSVLLKENVGAEGAEPLRAEMIDAQGIVR